MSDHDEDVARMEAEGAPPAPDTEEGQELDAFTSLMETGKLPDDYERVGPSNKHVLLLRRLMGQALKPVLGDTLSIELQLAFTNSFYAIVEHTMHQVDLPMFELHRQQSLELIGRIAAHINSIQPSAEQLAAVQIESPLTH